MIKIAQIALLTHTFPLARPFRFGIVELRDIQHLLVRVECQCYGTTIAGYAGENLIPKWFSKNPAQSLQDDIAELRYAIDTVGKLATSISPAGTTFDFWLALSHAAARSLPTAPPLVRQLAVSLFERGVIDAFCRAAGRPFAHLLHEGALGVRLDAIHPELRGTQTSDFIAKKPANALLIRHTIGLGDDLAELPQIKARTGVERFKIKLAGDVPADLARLESIAEALRGAASGREFSVTLDGNENYANTHTLSLLLQSLCRQNAGGLPGLRILWIEQPLHRDVALSDAVRPLLAEFSEIPHVIDESDAELSSLPRALELGYAGTTHKNCKGVFKSIAAACLLRHRQKATGRSFIHSGEDLTIVAPWSQTQDLAVAAAIGVVDVERNGHHYADGLGGFPAGVGDAAVAEHPDLYARDARGVVTLLLREGGLQLDSVLAAPFGSRGYPAGGVNPQGDSSHSAVLPES